MRKTTTIMAVTVLATVAACEEKGTVSYDGLSSFQVTITSGDTGSEENRIPVTVGGMAFDIEVQAVDGYGNPLAWNGEAALNVVPGSLVDSADTTMQVTSGTGSASILVDRAFGPTRVWVEDVGTSEQPGTYATGLTETIWLDGLRIRNIQESDSTLRSPFEGERPVIRDGTMVVTRVSSDGFYVTDIDAYLAGGDARDIRDTEWASVFAFNYSVPENLRRGDVLTRLEGGVSEFYGLTELGFPVWEVGSHMEVPPPVPLDCTGDVAEGGLAMERWEAALIEVSDATVVVCPEFPDCPDLAQYGQWSIELPCAESVNVVSRIELPTFDPIANHGRTLERLVGILRQHQYASPQWIIEPRDADDICCPTCTPAMQGACP